MEDSHSPRMSLQDIIAGSDIPLALAILLQAAEEDGVEFRDHGRTGLGRSWVLIDFPTAKAERHRTSIVKMLVSYDEPDPKGRIKMYHDWMQGTGAEHGVMMRVPRREA